MHCKLLESQRRRVSCDRKRRVTTSHLSCCSLGMCLGWWPTACTCSWRLSCWRTAVTSGTRRRTLASRRSLWSRTQTLPGPPSSVSRQAGLSGSPQPEMFQLKTKTEASINHIRLNTSLENSFKQRTSTI